MKTLKINLELKERLPLHLQYEGQHSPQNCGFELDTRTGELTTFINYEIGNAVPIDVWEGKVLRFNVSPYSSASAITALAEENAEFFQSVLDGLEDAESFWDNNSIGAISDTVIISVSEQMQYETVPSTMAELDDLVDTLLSYDGDFGVYETEPTEEKIKEEVIDYIMENLLFIGEEVGQEIAQYILQKGLDAGEWTTELKEFAGLPSFKYEIRNASQSTGFGGNYKHYSDFVELKSENLKDAVRECDELQTKHDDAHVNEFKEDESFFNAPLYHNCLWEISSDGEERKIELDEIDALV